MQMMVMQKVVPCGQYLELAPNKSFKRTKNSWLLFVPHKL